MGQKAVRCWSVETTWAELQKIASLTIDDSHVAGFGIAGRSPSP
jgi:hypothetical protein